MCPAGGSHSENTTRSGCVRRIPPVGVEMRKRAFDRSPRWRIRRRPRRPRTATVAIHRRLGLGILRPITCPLSGSDVARGVGHWTAPAGADRDGRRTGSGCCVRPVFIRSIGDVGVRPVCVRGLLLPLPIRARPCGRLDPRGRRETRQTAKPSWSVVAIAMVLPVSRSESLLHPGASPGVKVDRRMIGRRLVHGQLRTANESVAPRHPAFRVDPSK